MTKPDAEIFEVSYKSPNCVDRYGNHATVNFIAHVWPNEIMFVHEMGEKVWAWLRPSLLDAFQPRWRFSNINDPKEESCLRVVAEKVYEEYLARIVVS